MKCIHNFLVTTDKDEEVAYLNKLDVKAKGVDVIDDYETEQKEVRKAKGRKYPFSQSDYILKACVGACSKKFDQMDESRKGLGRLKFWKR